ncbi:MAG: PAS domain-containing protein [Thermoleophilia bacterium]
MARERPVPTSHESRFGLEELFFSRTDRKGHIRSGNDVFVRVSGWPQDTLIGAAHNIVRHPDMPRAAFQLVWDQLLADRPVAAYVKNMARDGSYYWVMATIVPHDGGFLSVRLKPTAPHFDAAQALYAAVRAVELELEAEGTPVDEVIAASMPVLVRGLSDAGFRDYAEFMRAALPAELSNRDAAVTDDRLVGSDTGLALLGKHIDGLFATVEQYVDCHAAVHTGLEAVRSFAEGIRLGAMNTLLAAVRLDSRAATLGAVADLMGQSASAVAAEAAKLRVEAEPILELLHAVAFQMSLAKVQADMARFFALEMEDGAGEGAAVRELDGLVGMVSGAVTGVLDLRTALEGQLPQLRSSIEDLERRIGALRNLEVAGRIEVARTDDAARVVTMFNEVGSELERVGERIGQMHKAIDRSQVGVDREALERDGRRAREESAELCAACELSLAETAAAADPTESSASAQSDPPR